MPNNAMACTSKASKCTSHKEMSSKNAKEHSCDKSSHSKNNNHNCDGKCKHSKCVCPSLSLVSFLYSEVNTSVMNIEFVTSTQRFPNFQTVLSTGFGSLWIIPKIG